MDPEKLKLIVRYALGVASQKDEWTERELGPIHLLKLAYLADVAFAVRHGGETFTGVPWRFYKLGPWDDGAHSAIVSAAHDSGAHERQVVWDGTRETTRWSVRDAQLADSLLRSEDKLPFEVASAVQQAVKRYGKETNELLHHVYLTKPMLHAAPLETLDFSVVLPEPSPEDDIVAAAPVAPTAPMSKTAARRLRDDWFARRDALRAQMKAGATRRQLVPAPTQPIYDEVFEAGVAALDEMAGPTLPIGEHTVKISPEIWKSRGRRESDLS